MSISNFLQDAWSKDNTDMIECRYDRLLKSGRYLEWEPAMSPIQIDIAAASGSYVKHGRKLVRLQMFCQPGLAE